MTSWGIVRRRLSLSAAGLGLAALTAVAAGAVRGFAGGPEDRGSDANAVARDVARGAAALDSALATLSDALAAWAPDQPHTSRVRAAFRASRRAYKRLEGVAEFYAPALAAAMNSRRQEVDDDDAPPPSSLGAAGFPAIEGIAWPAPTPATKDSARRMVERLRLTAGRLAPLGAALVPTDAQLVEVARHELARVSTLGIAGFDTPRTRDAMVESADALDGVLALYDDVGGARWPRLAAERRAMDSTWTRAAAYLRSHGDFDGMDRLAFLAEYAEPAAKALDALRRASNTASMRIPRGWRADVASVYEAGAFDPRAYAPSAAPTPTSDIVALGARLFAEPALSGTGTRSCASCHFPARAFTDGRSRQTSLDPTLRVKRHTPTLLNAALQPAQFADERSVTLEDQVREVLASRAEMSSSVDLAAKALGRSVAYRSAFAHAFAAASGRDGEIAPDTVTAARVQMALAAYVRSLVALDSRFDRAVRGDSGAITPQERNGFNLFMGKAGCGTCHFAPLFSGNTPPLYVGSDVEVIGTPTAPSRPADTDPDSGRAGIDRRADHLFAFKTPTVRNAALTAPYMHNGAFKTLAEVVRLYDGGGGRGAGSRLANQTLATDSLHLTRDEQRAIVAFIGALTDTAYLVRRFVSPAPTALAK